MTKHAFRVHITAAADESPRERGVRLQENQVLISTGWLDQRSVHTVVRGRHWLHFDIGDWTLSFITNRSSLEPVDGDLSAFISPSDAANVLAFLEETEEWLYAPEEEDNNAPDKVRRLRRLQCVYPSGLQFEV